MRQETREAIRDAVAMSENSCQEFGHNMETYFGTTDLDKVAEYLYKDVIELGETDFCYSNAIRFDGKKAIIKAIKAEVAKPKYEYLNR